MKLRRPHVYNDEGARQAEPRSRFRSCDVPIPQIGPGDVLVRVEKAGLCGTDRHIYSWDGWAQKRVNPPLVVGHEFMGTVAAVGGAVRSVRVGERVSGEGQSWT